jgi:large subunit ribosomal protein L19
MRNKQILDIEKMQTKQNLPPVGIGDQIVVYVRIKEGNKERLQLFEGLVIAKRGTGASQTIRVRKISYGIGVERVFPLHSPIIAEIKILRKNKVRRAKLYYMRELKGKSARLKQIRK